MPYFPTVERHYLTSDNDVVDSIAWDYYGVTAKTTEAIYKRNSFLTEYPARLPAGLLIVLPTLNADDVLPKVQLWEYEQPDFYEIPKVAEDERRQAEADSDLRALEDYRRIRDYLAATNPVQPNPTFPGSGGGGSNDGGGGGAGPGTVDPGNPPTPPGGGGGGGSGSGCCDGCFDGEPRTLGNAEFLAVWFKNPAKGNKWCLAKMKKPDGPIYGSPQLLSPDALDDLM